jgi:transformer-2 protein
MALFGRDYDRDFDGDYDRGFRSFRQPGPRTHWSTSGSPVHPNVGGAPREEGWGSYRSGTGGRYGGEYRGYGDDYRYRGYDRNYKSRWQTDYGDPFGDRLQQTPMRIIRGRARGRDFERGFASPARERGHETAYPMGYRPYRERTGYDEGYGQRTYRTYGGRYDTGWF